MNEIDRKNKLKGIVAVGGMAVLSASLAAGCEDESAYVTVPELNCDKTSCKIEAKSVEKEKILLNNFKD